MKTKFILTILMIAGIAVSANAQSVQGKDRNEHARIMNGAKSGELTKGERHRLAKHQRHIHHNIRRAKKDGHMGYAERKHIRHEQRRASHRIYKAKHNNRKWS